MHQEGFVFRNKKDFLLQEQSYEDVYHLFCIKSAKEVFDVGFSSIRRVLIDRSGEINFLFADLVLDENMPALVRCRYLFHDVDYVSLDGYLCVRQVYTV